MKTMISFRKILCFLLCILITVSNVSYAQGDSSAKLSAGITREELSEMLNKAFDLTETDKVGFKDVKKDSAYYNDLLIAKKAGYFHADKNNNIKPTGKVSRQELAYAIHILMKLNNSDKSAASTFKDGKRIAAWSKKAVEIVVTKGLMQLKSGRKFNPEGLVTKGEVVEVLEKSLKLVTTFYNKEGKYSAGAVAGSIEINASGVTLENTIIQGDLIIGKGVGDGNVTLSNVIVKGDTLVKGGGMNSIIVENSQLKHLRVMKVGNMVRVVAVGTTRINTTDMESGGKLEEQQLTGTGFEVVVLNETIDAGAPVTLVGSFDTLEIIGDSLNIVISGGTVGQLTISASARNTQIEISAGAVIKNLILNAVAVVKGSGIINSVTPNVTGSSITASIGLNAPTPSAGTGSTIAPVGGTGGGSGSGAGGGGGSKPVTIPISGISEITGTLQVGSALSAGALNPTSATVTYQWQNADSSNGAYKNIMGATASKYTLTLSDINKYLRVVVIGTGSFSGTVTSKVTKTVVPDPDIAVVEADKNAITEASIWGGNTDLSHVTGPLASIPATGTGGSSIRWESNMLAVLSSDGQIVVRPAFGMGDKTVILKAIITKGVQTATKEFTVKVLAETLDPDIALVEADKNALTETTIKGGNGDLLHVTEALATLPNTGAKGSTITWVSDAAATLSNNGQTVARPAFGTGDKTVILKATLTKGAQIATKEFIVKVLAETLDPDIALVEADKNALTEATIKGGNVDLLHVMSALATLPTTGTSGSTISWISDNAGILSNNGQTVVRAAFGTGDKTVVLKATLTKGAQTATKEFTVKVLAETVDPDIALVEADKNALTEATIRGGNPDLAHVTGALATLPITGTNGSTITWASDASTTLSNNGQIVVRPAFGTGDKTIALQATLTKGIQTAIKEFTVKVLAETLDPDIALIEADKNALTEATIRGGNPDLSHVTGALANLPTTGTSGSTISWTSDNSGILSNNGQAVVRPAFGMGDKSVVLQATLTKGAQTATKEFTVIVLAETLDPDIAFIEADLNALTEEAIKGGNSDLSHVLVALATLPTRGTNGSTISWTSNFPVTLSNDGQTVKLPFYSQRDKTVQLSAGLTKGSQTRNKIFTITVLVHPDDTTANLDRDSITANSIKGSNIDITQVTTALTLPTFGPNGSTISWRSEEPGVISNDGLTVNRPGGGAGNKTVGIHMTVKKGTYENTGGFNITVLAQGATALTENKVTGDIGVGSSLTSTPSPADANVLYQWKRADSETGPYTNIPGANASTYKLTSADFGKYVLCAITGYGNAMGTIESSPIYGSTSTSDFVWKSEGEGFGINEYKGTKGVAVIIPKKCFTLETTKIFYACFAYANLTSITLPAGLKYIEASAFSNNNLTSIIIPEGVIRIEHSAFKGNKLTQITIGTNVTMNNNILCDENDNFRTAYIEGGAGTYVGTQTGTWTKQ